MVDLASKHATVPATTAECKGGRRGIARRAIKAAGVRRWWRGRSGQRTDCQAQHCGAKRQPQTLFVAARLVWLAGVRRDLARFPSAPLLVETTDHARQPECPGNLLAFERRSQQRAGALCFRAPSPKPLPTARAHVAGYSHEVRDWLTQCGHWYWLFGCSVFKGRPHPKRWISTPNVRAEAGPTAKRQARVVENARAHCAGLAF